MLDLAEESDPLLAEQAHRLVTELQETFPGIDWRQWNGQFRDDVRQFVKGDPGMVGSLIQRLYGSDWLFPDGLPDSHSAFQSVNYVDAHDGLCLADLVSYTRGDQLSWDCGWNGEAGAPETVLALRRRQIKNLCCLLLLANGTPMFM